MLFGTDKKEMNREAEKWIEELLEGMKNSVRNKPERYNKLVRVAWHCYFDPDSLSQTHIAQKLNISESLVSHYRGIFDSLVSGANLTVDEYILFNTHLSTRLAAIIPEFKKAGSNKAKAFISKPPGTNLLALVDFFFSPKTVELTFKPLIADWQSEYFEALNQKRKYKARWTSVRYHFAFACTFIIALGLSKVFSLFKQVSK